MTHLHNPDAIADLNQFTLRKLARTLVSCQGQFTWLWLQCNSIPLQEQIIQDLKILCPVKWRELNLVSSVTNLYQTVTNFIGHQNPSALMITGLESVQDLDSFFNNLHLTQNDFGKNFPFPIMVWLTDEMNQILKHYAPELRHNTVDPFRFDGIPIPTTVNHDNPTAVYSSPSKIKLPQPNFEAKMQQLSNTRNRPETFTQNRINSRFSTPQRPAETNISPPPSSRRSPVSHTPTLPKVFESLLEPEKSRFSSSFSSFNPSPSRENVAPPKVNRSPLNQIPQILILDPDTNDEIASIIDTLRAGVSVLINFSKMSPQEAQRSLDFLSGGTFAIDGDQTRIGEQLFIFTPSCVKLSMGY